MFARAAIAIGVPQVPWAEGRLNPGDWWSWSPMVRIYFGKTRELSELSELNTLLVRLGRGKCAP